MRSIIISAVLVIGTIAVSCSKSGLETSPVPPKPNGTPVEVSLSTAPLETPLTLTPSAKAARTSGGGALTVEYGVPDSKSVTSLTSDQEQKVNDLWVIQFDKATGTLVGEPYYATPEQISQNGTAVSFEARLTTASTPQVVYFVANTNSPSTFTASNCGTVTAMESVCRQLTAEYKPTAAGGLPMLAAQEYAVIASGTPLTGATLRRLVAKVVLRYRVSPDFAGFTLTGVRLRNVPTTMWYAAEKSGTVDFPAKNITYGSESHFDYPAEDLSKAEADGEYMTFTWYVPENLRKAVTAAADQKERVLANTDGMATCIEISGNFKSPLKCERLAYHILLGDAQNDVDDYNVRRNRVYTATVTIEGANAADQRIDVQPLLPLLANCGMVRPAKYVAFDVEDRITKAKAATPSITIGWTKGTAYTPLLIWQDVQGLVSQLEYDSANGYLTVSTDAAKGAAGGNAVVGLFPSGTSNPAAGTCIWSWHVWVTDYQPDGTVDYGLAANERAVVNGGEVHTYGTAYMNTVKAVTPAKTSRVMMDRNLGATAALYKLVTTNAENYPTYGLFYEWGRKDPFPKAPEGVVADKSTTSQTTYNASGTATGYPTRTAGPVTILKATQNPHVFYYNGSGTYDWNFSPNDALWGDGTAKSVYDPCPEGWRTAPNGTWDDFGATWGSPFGKNSGWTPYDVDLAGGLYAAGAIKTYYPSPGCRHPYDGTLYHAGNFGLIWSSSVTGGNAFSFYFNYDGIYSNNGANCANGYQVRCLQE